MKWLKNYELFKESKTYSNKNLISEICISMVLLNNDFLDKLLDMGLKARYSENSEVFLTDLKNLLLSKNRLHLGKFEDNKCVSDNELSKINNLFDNIDFDIEKDWNLLLNSRNSARTIIDKLLGDEKLESDRIRYIYWIGPNKNDDYNEDIVIELNDGKQYSIFLNKNLSNTKTSSFNTFAEVLIGDDINRMFDEEYLPKWNKLKSW
jgi:ABC-type antimicrobial peptide transport system permease subunit